MTFKEAALRIEDHMIVHKFAEHPYAVKITEALDMATRLLLWIDEQPEFILEGNIVDLINEYYNNGLRDGFNRAKKIYDNVGRGYVKAAGKCPMCEDCIDNCPLDKE